ncbi:hypothetical protein KBD81_01530 [Candidatus Woesebacteria bacterium]|nr:hypothetical protein [Candidatus Woesebacteria bacterium]
MQYSRTFGGAFWTTHALQRLKGRKLPQEIAWKAFRFPEKTLSGKTKGTFEFTKTVDIYTVTVIAKQNEKREWVILSCWIDPPLAGSADLRKNDKRVSLSQWLFSVLKRLFTGT